MKNKEFKNMMIIEQKAMFSEAKSSIDKLEAYFKAKKLAIGDIIIIYNDINSDTFGYYNLVNKIFDLGGALRAIGLIYSILQSAYSGWVTFSNNNNKEDK